MSALTRDLMRAIELERLRKVAATRRARGLGR
jgi:hypothetical protein